MLPNELRKWLREHRPDLYDAVPGTTKLYDAVCQLATLVGYPPPSEGGAAALYLDGLHAHIAAQRP